ncbi:1,2-phenylacetyl-CoA epoxidase subunit PaaD [Azorhizophilus paspali]|uniref:1,2-phenylacetyl-CoA epoxidase subunit PaaD n=1 Tax=Azorhizophilus paspali TaxID=69963 RepID=A0ABV6SHN2_AZOPA
MVNLFQPVEDQQATASIWALLTEIPDPEMPYISIVDLGIVREVRWQLEALNVVLTPTYSGCPARREIERSIRDALGQAGVEALYIETRLHPAWTTEWISAQGREKMRGAGVAPPLAATQEWQTLTFWPNPRAAAQPPCPHCGHTNTRMQNESSGSRCKALYHCDSCRNPFEYFKSF